MHCPPTPFLHCFLCVDFLESVLCLLQSFQVGKMEKRYWKLQSSVWLGDTGLRTVGRMKNQEWMSADILGTAGTESKIATSWAVQQP